MRLRVKDFLRRAGKQQATEVFGKDNYMRKSTLASFIVLSAQLVAGGVETENKDARPAGEEALGVRFEKIASRMAEAINRGDYTGARADFAKVMEEALPPEKATIFFRAVIDEYGKITRLDSPHIVPPNQAVIVGHCERGTLDIRIIVNDEDKIMGLWFLPHRPKIPVPDAHKSRLSLPFRGRWLVKWGGDTKELNYHHDTPSQRFAFDFLAVNENGETQKGNGLSNEDYFAFGREILAPGDGVVTDVITGVRDNVPGSMNPYSALGNAVLIRHRQYEVSVLAHLKFGSIRVKVGDKVKRGKVIGLCGNSGNSSEPHLHYHLQNTPIIQDGTGIKCRFERMGVVIDGKEQQKEDYSAVKGEIVVGSK